jgi:hypothetical protein
MDVEKLYEILKNIQDPKSYYYNKGEERTFKLLEGLLINRSCLVTLLVRGPSEKMR